MRYFTFFGKSCLNILGPDKPLMLVSMNGQADDVPGSEKEVIRGKTSIYKTIANEYGNMYDDVLEFDYTLIPFNDEIITPAEQRVIETWLTSPKLSQYLQLFDIVCDSNEMPTAANATVKAIYCGTFVETEWISCGDGFFGVNFTFQCDSPYAWQFHDEVRYISGSNNTTINIATDDTQDYVYPRITFTMKNDGESPIMHDVEFSLKNITDEGNGFTMSTQIDKSVVMDCRACRVTDNAGNLFRYDDLGWGDVGNIYWPRLVHGLNTLSIENDEENTTLELKISYMSPHKIVGGWL